MCSNGYYHQQKYLIFCFVLYSYLTFRTKKIQSMEPGRRIGERDSGDLEFESRKW